MLQQYWTHQRSEERLIIVETNSCNPNGQGAGLRKRSIPGAHPVGAGFELAARHSDPKAVTTLAPPILLSRTWLGQDLLYRRSGYGLEVRQVVLSQLLYCSDPPIDPLAVS